MLVRDSRTQRSSRLLLILGMIWCVAGIPSAFCDDGTTASLTCGGTRFTAITHSVHTYATAEEMWARPAGARQGRKVDLRQFTFLLQRIVPGLAVVADRVSEWACARTPKRAVLMLWYDCP